MRIRKLALVAAAAAPPFGLTACGGAGVDDFCAQYEAIDQIQEADVDQAKAELEELAENVPDEAGDDVQEAADLMAETFPSDGDLDAAIGSGALTEEDAQEFLAAVETVTTYGTENCES
ncbi:hypothetical protein [Blastococcus saxobsidens]|uniref:Lipoprotein n=1 Tax=Blastococcus saxobsidens (strain DD2) TaxID=1146883 RepID=H6RJD9_BLASD|nr:hypothetical protein [Blastococcus saxobsidens]CCG01052.1 exported protein of unknown function; putative coiled-coil domain [Blastococcus saxobsidens DD2]